MQPNYSEPFKIMWIPIYYECKEKIEALLNASKGNCLKVKVQKINGCVHVSTLNHMKNLLQKNTY
jgi:hypothetical protein